MRSVFEFEGYRDFLQEGLGSGEHGARSRLARAARCSPSWITRALAGKVQLTPDQAYAVAEHFQLSDLEADYFLLLVDKERAASLPLRRRLERRCEELRAESKRLSSEMRTDLSVSETHRARYYSSWLFPSVHVACMIRALAVEEIAEFTAVSRETATGAVRELTELGLLQKKGAKWEATAGSVHLPSDHPLTGVMHASWRSRTTQRLQEGRVDGLHYSGVHCLSRADIEEIRRRLTDVLLDLRGTIEKSPSEAMAVLCMDWYVP